MPTAPTITHATWCQNQPLSGTLDRFLFAARWDALANASSYTYEITADADSIAASTTSPAVWWDTDSIPGAGNTFEVYARYTGTYSADAATDLLTAAAPHGLEAGMEIVFFTTSVTPGGLALVTTYYVIASGLTSTAFKVSTTLGGGAVNITGAGTGTQTYGASGSPAVLSLTPTVVSGPSSISAALNGNVFSGFSLGPTRPTDWAWTLSGAPTGLSITAKDGASDGGIIVGSPSVEGVFDATVGVTNYGATSNILSVQNYAVKIHVSGERYLQDFHSDTSRAAVNIRHPQGTAASWNTNAAGEVDLTLGDSVTLHAILRNGTGYLTAGVTNLKLTAKLPQRPDSPPVLSASAPAPAVATFGAVHAWPLTVSVESPFARRLFDTANLPPGATPDATGILLDAQITYTYGGATRRSSTFKIRLLQPVSQL